MMVFQLSVRGSSSWALGTPLAHVLRHIIVRCRLVSSLGTIVWGFLSFDCSIKVSIHSSIGICGIFVFKEPKFVARRATSLTLSCWGMLRNEEKEWLRCNGYSVSVCVCACNTR